MHMHSPADSAELLAADRPFSPDERHKLFLCLGGVAGLLLVTFAGLKLNDILRAGRTRLGVEEGRPEVRH